MNIENQHPQDLLPWYVNGTLEAAELKQVESHLQSCTACQREVELLRAMQQHVQDEVIDGPGDLARKRLMRDIKNQKKSERSGRHWWEPWLAVAAMLVIIIQAGVIISPSDDGPPVEMLGNKTADIKVMFQPNSKFSDITALLKKYNARFHSGPDNENFYVLDVKKLSLLKHPKKIKAIIKNLNDKHSNIIKYADTE